MKFIFGIQRTEQLMLPKETEESFVVFTFELGDHGILGIFGQKIRMEEIQSRQKENKCNSTG